MARLFLERAGIVRVRRLSTRGLRTTTGAIAGFMALNTVANLTSWNAGWALPPSR